MDGWEGGWIDDEIELLKAHIIYLEKKNYLVTSVSSGEDGIKIFHQLFVNHEVTKEIFY